VAVVMGLLRKRAIRSKGSGKGGNDLQVGASKRSELESVNRGPRERGKKKFENSAGLGRAQQRRERGEPSSPSGTDKSLSPRGLGR